jgi:adenine-specific DNA-methyltransferase
MPPRKKTTTQTPTGVEAIRHTHETRTNIPTEELRGFVAQDEDTPQTMLYPRDPSLDPQLVWKGKDEQDRADLQVPVVPIYIQEKIHPQAIIDDLPRIQANPALAQMDMFADFNGIGDDFDRKVEFYQHQQHWTNRLILGDSLLTMTSLAEKEGLKGKVQMIYLDPPYGIKFGSNWQVSTRKRDVKDGAITDATRQPEQVRAFRDTWQLGIHSFLAYLRDRLIIARELLTDSGSVFVQIGDENIHLVRTLLDEVFGFENFVSQITFKKTSGTSGTLLGGVADYILWFAKDKESIKYRAVYSEKDPEGLGASQYKWVEESGCLPRPLLKGEDFGNLPKAARLLRHSPLTSQRPPGDFPVSFKGREYRPKTGYWKTNLAGLNRLINAERVMVFGQTLEYLRYLDDFPVSPLSNIWNDTVTSGFADPKTYVVQTNPKVVERCMLMSTDPGDLVLDPTCGSGTTAYVAEQWGRRWITIDTSRVALALARTRLMAAKFPYFTLADTPEGIAKETELTGKTPPPYPTEGDIRKGFVYKRVPHITLKSIANNPDIKEGMTRQEIDAAIARHAEFETLFDQPYEDSKRIRVTGPFTVESLSPHRVLSTGDDDQDGQVTPQEEARQGDFATNILDNLRKAGVQNGFKGQRLQFDRLEVFPGKFINATGEFTDADGKTQRVAVALGPEYGTVGPDQVKSAAKEAVQGIGFDVLIVAGFAFDAHVPDEAKRYGSLTVLPVKMNPDLALGEDLLKKTGAGNLFMVFGEPDVEIDHQGSEIVVKINGVDVYDPTTGDVRSNDTKDIACWFIDTDYNEESFFVRHAYFTGAQEPYDRLKRALRAEIDEDAWASLYRTESRPFAVPSSGKIAVKVINHYGDEVMKVYDVA